MSPKRAWSSVNYITALPVMGVFLTLFKPRVFLLYLCICLSGTMLVAVN